MHAKFETLEVSRDGAVLVVKLNSPKTRNSLTTELREEIGHAVTIAEEDASVRAMLLTGNGPTFCSGGDFKMLQTATDPWTVHRRFRALNRWLLPLLYLRKPVVIGVRGTAVGGGMGLALSGDLLIAGESASFLSGFFRLGVVPDIGMMYHLPRLMGMARAKQFLFANSTMSAREAADLGIVAKVVPDAELFEAALGEARRLAAGPTEAIGLAKSVLARSFETSMADMFTLEGFAQGLAMSGVEFAEGLAAVLEKREADFAGAGKRTP